MPKNSEIVEYSRKSDISESRLEIRECIEQYEATLRDLFGSERGEMDEIDGQGLSEYLTGGAYTRVLRIPADVTIVSRLWNRERLWIIVYGKVRILTENGNETIEAPYIGKAPYGSKVALYAETETLWAAITGCPETDDLSKVGDIVTVKDYTEVPLLQED